MGVTRKLIVEIVDARSLLPKDGHGTSSPYVVVDFYGQRKRTRSVTRDLNPVWNEVLEFNVGAPSDVFGDMVELDVYHDRIIGPTRRNNFLGRIRLNSAQFVRKGEEALIYFPLEKKSFFSWIQGEIGLKVYYVDEPVRPPSPPAPPPPPEKADTPVPEAEPPKTEEGATPLNPDQSESDSKANEDAQKSDTPPETSPPPPVEAPPPTEEPAPAEPPPPENVEKPSEPDQPPPESSASPVTSPPAPAPPDEPEKQSFTEFEATHKWIPQPEPMASMISRSTSDIKLAGFSAARPISRQTTSDSFFMGDSSRSMPIERSTYDLVEKMHYLFIKIVKARQLPTNNNPTVKISISNCHIKSKPARKTSFFEWDQTFAFSRDTPESLSTMEISVWDPQSFLGGICFDVTEIPIRDPPDSPLAPQWYRLEGGGAHHGDLMLATWIGTQADEAFSEAWKSDTVANVNSRSKIYLSPKLWYLRATVIEAQDVLPLTALRESTFQVKVQLGFQILKTKSTVSRDGSPSWNEDLIFVAAEPFSDHLVFSSKLAFQKEQRFWVSLEYHSLR
ncbi:hypothetical protein IFM89_013513 [Coptis chinensis]|uniref:C2 domain-containing protein n=1 Tax=Coptis chinensis TaxID=261450 RepID=A0A835H5X5_9MAGN|nr:hypothetical protein IFM89_013513 [Coptis chinensis]